MASITFYDYSIGSYTRALNVLLRILDKASSHPDVASFIDARLTPDMYTLKRQVQLSAAFPVLLAEALTGKQLVTWNEKRDNWGGEEKAWPELIARVEKALEVLKEVDPEEADARAAEGLKMSLRVGPDLSSDVPVRDWVMSGVTPNVFFHVYITYAILRSKGVDLGKKDVLIPFLPKYVAEQLAQGQVT